jgi:DNA/RNA endonuclease YhcR with UshA esterase domain
MIKRKYILLVTLALLFLSCGKKDDQPDFTDEKIGQPTEEKNENIEKPVTTQNDTGKSSGDLKFYSSTKPEAVVSPLLAKDYIGKVVTVKGFVADVYKTEKVAYLNFVEKFPENPFSGVIFQSKFKEFAGMEIYGGKNVELTGRVTVYKGKPQIIMDSKEQIKILN